MEKKLEFKVVCITEVYILTNNNQLEEFYNKKIRILLLNKKLNRKPITEAVWHSGV
jgi:hypothetical protein